MPRVGQPAVQWEPLTAQWFSAVSNIIQHPLLIYRIFKLTWLITFTAYIHRVFVCLRLCVCLHVCGVHLLCLFRLRLRQVLHTHRGSVCNQCPPRQPDHASEYSSLLRQKKKKKKKKKTETHTHTTQHPSRTFTIAMGSLTLWIQSFKLQVLTPSFKVFNQLTWKKVHLSY